MAQTLINGINPIKAGSRYETGGAAGKAPPDSVQNTSSGGTSTGSQTGSQSSTGTGTSNTSQTQNSTQTTRNMDPKNMAILDDLIQMLMGGGTPDMKRQRAVRDQEREQVSSIRRTYGKTEAFDDARGLIAQQMRRALEQMMPSISRAAEDAGSSGGALRALLMQDAADKASESSSALGVKTAVDYGNITSNLSQVMERLTTPDNSALNGLIGALGVAKGANSTTTGSVNTTGQTNTTENKTVTSNQNNVNNENKNTTTRTDYAPFDVRSRANNSPIYFGPEQTSDPQRRPGTTADLLEQLYGSSAWSGYKF